MTRIVGGIFCLSGAAALVFETLWFRQAGLAFGNTVWASSIVLASFMAGLALGNALAARFGHRVQRPLLAYAVLEVLVGSAGLVLVWNLAQLGPLLAPFLGQFVDNPVLLNVLRLVIAFFLLLVPATAMGATLPLLVKLLRAYDPSFGSALGKLYGWNAAGAVVGALAGEVALIEWFGIRGTAAFALFMDGVAALGALLLSRRFESAPARARRQGRKPQKLASDDAARVTTWTFDATRFLCAAALAGGILLALEVLWFRFLLLFVHSGSLTFPMMLAVVLAGISLGGFFAGTWLRHREGAHRNASNVAFLAGASVVVLYRAFSLAYAPYGTEYIDEPRVILWLSVVLMLLGSTLSGVLFTLTGTALRGTMQPETRAVGLLTLANTLGATAGALIAGFVCIPFLGMERSFFGAAALYGIVGLVLLRRRAAQATPRRRYIAYVAPTLFVGTLVLFPFGLMQEHYFRVPVRRYDPDATMQVVATREGRSETVTYLRKDFAGEPEYYKMLTNGFSMSGTRPGSRRYMKLYAYLPVALHPDPKRALLISYGVGSTAKALTDTPSLESIDVVDISKEILEMSDIVFPNPTETH